MPERQEGIPDTIFISHASKDQNYVRELVSLLAPLNIPNIVCSSLHGYHIPNNEDIYEYLNKNLHKDGRVVYLFSKNYYQSPACLNEMGACWVLNKNYTTILTPNFSFEEIKGAINPNKMSLKLDDEYRLADFIQSIQKEFNTGELPTPIKLSELVKKTVQNIKNISYDEKKKLENLVWDVEGCRVNGDQLELVLRIINHTNEKRRMDSIIINLKDRDGHTFSKEINDINIQLHENENRVFYFTMDHKGSNYNPYNTENKEIEIINYKDVW